MRVFLAALVALAATGCAEKSRGDAPESCLNVSDGVADAILEGGRADLGAAPRTLNARAASARHVSGVTVVAIYVTGPGGTEDTGLWTVEATSGNPGEIHSIDSVARDLTYWPSALVTEKDAGVSLTRECV